MRRLDRGRAIDFVDVEQADATCPIDRATLRSRFYARENREIVSGAAAFSAAWRAIPMLRPLGLLARNRLALAEFERLYRVFLKARPALQRAMRRAETVGGAQA